MASSLAQPNLPTPLLVSEKPRRQAKAALKGIRKAEKNALWIKDGAAMREVQNAFGLTLKEFAAALGRDERQIERQMQGMERPQVEAVRAIQRFEGPMLVAMARRANGVEVDTVVHIRHQRSA